MDHGKDTSRCTWHLGTKQPTPHIHEQFNPNPKKIYDDVLDAIGRTPMVKINKVGVDHGIKCALFAKCEFMNMGGSVKDRIGRRMVIDAERTGLLKPGAKIVEATSGNTGIGLALASAVKGYECIITLPEKMSTQKVNVLKGLGATIIRTPTQAAFDSPQSHISIARNLRDRQGCILLDQYANPSNPMAHYDALAEQILYQTDQKIDAIIVGAGTGGTIAGIARKIKERTPHTLVVAADPYGSVLAMPQQLNIPAPPNKVEGIGYDFVPQTCPRQSIDKWVKTDDEPSFLLARELIRKEGLLVGGSSGSVIFAAIDFIKKQGWENDPTKRVVLVFSDSIRNYISKFLSKQWCVENRFLPYAELDEKENHFNKIPLSELKFKETQYFEDLTVAQAIDMFGNGAQIIPLMKDHKIYAAILPKKFLELVTLKKLSPADSALKTKTNDFVIAPNTITTTQLSKILQRHEAVILEERSEDGKTIKRLSVATPFDLIRLFK